MLHPLCCRTSTKGDASWALVDLCGSPGTFLNGARCTKDGLHSLKTKDIIGIGTRDLAGVREGGEAEAALVFEILSPASVIEQCRKYGMEMDLIEKCTSRYGLPQLNSEVDEEKKEDKKEENIRDIFSDVESDSEAELISWKMSKISDTAAGDSTRDSTESAMNSTESEDTFQVQDVDSNDNLTVKVDTVAEESQSDEGGADEDCLKIVSVESFAAMSSSSSAALKAPIPSKRYVAALDMLKEEAKNDDEAKSRESAGGLNPGTQAETVEVELSARASEDSEDTAGEKPRPCTALSPLKLRTKSFKCVHCSKYFWKYKRYKNHVTRRHGSYSVAGGGAELKLTVRKEQAPRPGLLAHTWTQSVQSHAPAPAPALRCGKCPAETMFSSRRSLYIHYALRHYREEVAARLGPDPRRCPEPGCGLTKRVATDLLAHLAADHRIVERFMPEDWRVEERETKTDDADATLETDSVSTSVSSDTEDRAEDRGCELQLPEPVSAAASLATAHVRTLALCQATEEALSCRLCAAAFPTRTELYNHYSR